VDAAMEYNLIIVVVFYVNSKKATISIAYMQALALRAL
jgi:hypothetical protein